MAPVTRTGLFILSGVLAVGGVICLLLGMSLMGGNIRDHVADNYAQYARDRDGTDYTCSGSPSAVADSLAAQVPPEARMTDRGSTYLRYDDEIVIVGPDGTRPAPSAWRIWAPATAPAGSSSSVPASSPAHRLVGRVAAPAVPTVRSDTPTKENPMYLAVEFGTISGESLAQNVVAATLYFVVGALVLAAGFALVDLLTPGNLRTLVFVEYRPNAVAVASGMYAALALVVVSAIIASSNELAQGWSTPRSTASSGWYCRGGAGRTRSPGAGTLPGPDRGGAPAPVGDRDGRRAAGGGRVNAAALS